MAKRILEFETTWQASDKHKRRVIVIAQRMCLLSRVISILQGIKTSTCESEYDLFPKKIAHGSMRFYASTEK